MLRARRRDNFLTFDSNYVSRCARGQGLKIKVPGCGILQLEVGLLCVHSSLEGADEQRALCFFFPLLPVRGLILQLWIMTPQVSCLLLWHCLPMAPMQNKRNVKRSGWEMHMNARLGRKRSQTCFLPSRHIKLFFFKDFEKCAQTRLCGSKCLIRN